MILRSSATTSSSAIVVAFLFRIGPVLAQFPWQDNGMRFGKSRFQQADGGRFQSNPFSDWPADTLDARRANPQFQQRQVLGSPPWPGLTIPGPNFNSRVGQPRLRNEYPRNGVRTRGTNNNRVMPAVAVTDAPTVTKLTAVARTPDNMVNDRFSNIQYNGNYDTALPRQFGIIRRTNPARTRVVPGVSGNSASPQIGLPLTGSASTTLASTTTSPPSSPDTTTKEEEAATTSTRKRKMRKQLTTSTRATTALPEEEDEEITLITVASANVMVMSTPVPTTKATTACESVVTVSRADFARIEATGIFSQLKSGTCLQIGSR
ncbi:hypothetical protein BV898_07775 [Hypsibius exemplaris]|uniref:Uncharacterized protein n=1 Tax=Hypsibius exemplaris TaxID=2072580 RepID=A0A1W0WSM1_HYPEX|nr:hypothetical protein BV898_07775 [Hypsibius exemplaris]